MALQGGRFSPCRLPPFRRTIIIGNMRSRIFLLLTLLGSSVSWAGIVDNVRTALDQNNFSAAQSELNAYRNQRGVDGEYLEALSWMGRAALNARQYDQAADYAKQTKTLAIEELKKRPMDAEPHLPMALGAAFEVQSQVLVARGAKPQAVALLESALKTYGNTSIAERLQKNINVLSL